MMNCNKRSYHYAGVMLSSLLIGTSAMAATAVDVNHADVLALSQVAGIGKVRAKAIVAYRKAHGPFAKLDDLVHVKGLGKKSVTRLRPKLVVHARSARRH